MRASDSEREQIVTRLQQAAAEGRITAHELEQRVSTALRARTHGDLEQTVADLPSRRVVARRRPAPQSALLTVRDHPALALVAIPVVVLAVAALITLTALWTTLMILWFVLGHRGRFGPGPWRYASRRLGPDRAPSLR
ncbi:MAG: DUF1707 SHOCT-like domain-containing protein [Solirubrobacteraceae bacterium]